VRQLLVLPIAVAIARLCFDAVAIDCAGGPEVVVRYPIATASTLLTGWTAPTPEVPEPQPIYISAPGPEIADVMPGPARLCVDLVDDPQPGSVYYYRPEAVDIGGNSSTACE